MKAITKPHVKVKPSIFILYHLPLNMEQNVIPKPCGNNQEPHEKDPVESGAARLEGMLEPSDYPSN
jgi:hypothetical protein